MTDLAQQAQEHGGWKRPRPVTVWQLPVVMWALLLIPAMVLALRYASTTVVRDFMARYVSLAHAPLELQPHIEVMLLVPLSAVIVSFFRLTLGLRVLGLFRPILLALAFRITGIPLGLAFLIALLGGIALVRPMLKGSHYFARMSVLLCLVASALLAPLFVANWWHAELLDRVAYFPVIALCLTCESFAGVLAKHGLSAAAGRTATTTIASVIVVALTYIPGFMTLLLACPELLMAEIGSILFIDRYLDLRLFDRRWKLSSRAPKWRVRVDRSLEERRAL